MSTQSYHIPRLPSRDQWGLIARLTIDTVRGKIYNGQKEIGFLDGGPGYVRIAVGSRRLKRANLIWWKATGEWPPRMLDHKNRDKSDDRFDNLELTTNSANAMNIDKGMKSRHGHPKGVTYNPTASGGANKPFVTWLVRDGKKLYLGRYSTADQASQAYVIGLAEYTKDPNQQAAILRATCKEQVKD